MIVFDTDILRSLEDITSLAFALEESQPDIILQHNPLFTDHLPILSFASI
jgi:hypothetical protein